MRASNLRTLSHRAVDHMERNTQVTQGPQRGQPSVSELGPMAICRGAMTSLASNVLALPIIVQKVPIDNIIDGVSESQHQSLLFLFQIQHSMFRGHSECGSQCPELDKALRTGPPYPVRWSLLSRVRRVEIPAATRDTLTNAQAQEERRS